MYILGEKHTYTHTNSHKSACKRLRACRPPTCQVCVRVCVCVCVCVCLSPYAQVSLPQLSLLEAALTVMPRVEVFVMQRSGKPPGNVFEVSVLTHTHVTVCAQVRSTSTHGHQPLAALSAE